MTIDEDDELQMPENVPLMDNNESSRLSMTLNGTPVNGSINKRMGHDTNLKTRESVLNLAESQLATQRIKQFQKAVNRNRNGAISDGHGSRKNEGNKSLQSPKASKHRSAASGSSLRRLKNENSLSKSKSRTTSLRTTSLRHKNKKKPRNVKKVKSIKYAEDDDENESIKIENIPTRANVYSPRNTHTTTSKTKLTAPPRVRKVQSKKNALHSHHHHSHSSKHKTKKPSPSLAQRTADNKQKPKQKQKQRQKVTPPKPKNDHTNPRTSAMLNSKERKPSIMTLFGSGKKHKNKSRK